MEVLGKLKVKNETKQVSEKFKNREFVITDNSSQYPQHISLQLTQDKCALLDAYNVGDELKVQINIRGREWTSPQGEIKYFNTLEAWKVEKVGGTSNSAGPAKQGAAKTNVKESVTTSQTFVPSNGDEDLPF